jgi:hypothetical protein
MDDDKTDAMSIDSAPVNEVTENEIEELEEMFSKKKLLRLNLLKIRVLMDL